MSFNLENQAQPVPVSLINPAAPTGWHEPEEAYARRRRRPRAADRRGRGHKEVETPVTLVASQTRRPVIIGRRRVPNLYQRTRDDGTTVFEASGRLGGRMTRRTLTATTKTDAAAELQALKVDYARGDRRPRTDVPTVAELLDGFTAHMQSRVDDPDVRRRRSRRTVDHYDYMLRRHVLPTIGTMRVTDVTAVHVRRVLDAMAKKKLSPSTRTGTLTALSSLLGYAVKQGVLERNPVRDLDRDDRPGTARLTEPRYLSVDEIGRLLAAMGDTFRPVAATCAYAGLRASEALGLRWRDVDLKTGTITVAGQLGRHGERVPVKTAASAAAVSIVPKLDRELRAHGPRRSVSIAAYTRTRSVARLERPQSERNALRAVHAAGKKAGLNPAGRQPVGLHDLRHSFVAIALAGMTLTEASTLARHANARVTAVTYAGLSDQAHAGLAGKLAAAFEA